MATNSRLPALASTMLPALTEEERSILRNLASDGPTTAPLAAARGRLALYGLIDETPEGWIITHGTEAIARAPVKENQAESRATRDPEGPDRSRTTGNRLPNRRRSPFL
jgi:hypothetical protein